MIKVPERIRNIPPAPIDVINSHAEKIRRSGAKVISLGQAIPGFSTVTEAINVAREAAEELSTHIYSSDAGILPLRAALGAVLKRYSGLEVDPHQEIIITAGGNQAFLLALLTLLEPGDKVLLPSPYFLNHEMAIRIVGGIPIEVPLSDENGFQLRVDDLKPFLDLHPKAAVIVSPNNPTGAVYSPEELKQIGQLLVSQGIVIITDETYQYFTYDDAQHFSIASVHELRSGVISIGTFSKTFSMTGWRVGYLLAEPPFIQEAMKVQDAMVICAPVISQKAALGALHEAESTIEQRRKILDQRRHYLAKQLESIPQLNWRPTSGAFFAFVRVSGCIDSARLALQILNEIQVVTIPGSAFGHHGEGFLRLSYGSVDLSELEEACGRLSRFFATV